MSYCSRERADVSMIKMTVKREPYILLSSGLQSVSSTSNLGVSCVSNTCEWTQASSSGEGRTWANLVSTLIIAAASLTHSHRASSGDDLLATIRNVTMGTRRGEQALCGGSLGKATALIDETPYSCPSGR